MNNINPEALALRDIHLPEPVSWWPIAPGWWLLLVSIIIVLIIAYISIKHYRKRQLKRDIKVELELLKQRFIDNQDRIELARSLSILMRRAGISYYPGQDIAGLIGDNWLLWLDETHTASNSRSPDSDNSFFSETGKILLTAPYMPDDAEVNYDTDSLVALCESWLFSVHNSSRTDRPVAENSRVTSS